MSGGGRLLGIDYGGRRIGIAVSDPLNIIARGLTVLENSREVYAEIAALVRRHDIRKVIVGLPLTLRGERGGIASEAEEFIRKLSSEIPVEIIGVDERFTTREAEETLRELGVPRTKRREKKRLDEMASALILQRYLDREGPAPAD